MSEGTLHWDDWYTSDGFKEHGRINFFQNVPFLSIFYEAMQLIEKVMPGGDIIREAEKLINVNPPIGFTKADADRVLYLGQFRNFNQLYKLRFEGPDLPEDAESWAAVSRSANPTENRRIRINFYKLIEYANSTPAYQGSPEGFRRFLFLVGAVVLHEVMHVEDFDHGDPPPDHSSDIPSHPYNRTLPEVAGQAYINVFDNSLSFLTLCGCPSMVTGVKEKKTVIPFSEYLKTKSPITQIEYKQHSLIKE